MQDLFYLNFFSHKSKIYVKYMDGDGRPKYKIVKDYTPPVYIPATRGAEVVAKSIYGVPLSRLNNNGGSIYETKKMIEEIEAPNFKVHGFKKVEYSYVYEEFKHQNPDHSKITVHFLDIETTVDHGKIDPIGAPEEIIMITVYCSHRKKYYSFYVHDKKVTLPEFDDLILVKCTDEEDLLRKYVEFHSSYYPDILTGWNTEGFDLPYIHNRIKKILGDEILSKLSPFGIISVREGMDAYGPYMNVEFKGVSCLDYKKIYEKFIKDPRESYSLDYISKIELDDEKLKHHSGIPGHLLYREYFSDALRYNIQDVRLLVKLEEKRKLLILTYTLSYISFCNFSDVLSNMRIIDMMFYMYLRDRDTYFEWNYSPPPRQQFEGAAVKDTIPGKYKWVATFDVTSEYPSLIMALNISPETLVKKKVLPIKVSEILNKTVDRSYPLENGYSLAGNGAMFTRGEEGFMSAVVRWLFAERQKYKKLKVAADIAKDKVKAEEYDIFNLAVKLILNSIYGVTGTPYFRFFDLLIAEGITLSGQSMVGWVIQDVNATLQKMMGDERDRAIASDTDSAYFDLSDLVERKFGPHGTYDEEKALAWVTKFSDEFLNEVIKKSIKKFSEYLNVRDDTVLHMKREKIADSSIFMAKKRYVMSIRNSEGAEYERGEELKLTGHAVVQSITPKFVKEAMKRSINALLFGTKEDYYKTVNDFRRVFSSTHPNEIAKTSSVNGISEYLERDGSIRKGCPKHSRAAITFNKYIASLGLEEKYPLIIEGTKIKFIGLKTPNPLKSTTIGWEGNMPDVLEDLRPFFDYDDQFETIFMKPVQLLADPCGIRPETDTLENPFL